MAHRGAAMVIDLCSSSDDEDVVVVAAAAAGAAGAPPPLQQPARASLMDDVHLVTQPPAPVFDDDMDDDEARSRRGTAPPPRGKHLPSSTTQAACARHGCVQARAPAAARAARLYRTSSSSAWSERCGKRHTQAPHMHTTHSIHLAPPAQLLPPDGHAARGASVCNHVAA